MLMSFADLSSRSLTFSSLVELTKDNSLSAVAAHFALSEPSKGVPRKITPTVLLAISSFLLSVPFGRDKALAVTRPPRLCVTNIIGLLDWMVQVSLLEQ